MSSIAPKQLAFPLDAQVEHTHPRYPKRVRVLCEVCGNPFFVPPSRFRGGTQIARYCSAVCASIGRPRNVIPWAKGRTKADDPRLAAIAEAVHQSYVDNPERGRGERHHMFGKHHSEAAREKMIVARATQEVTPAMLIALEEGRAWAKGKTKEDDERIARRGRTLSKLTTGVPDPEHAERMRRFYIEHPDKHPNRILFHKGHETGIERAMRLALEEATIPHIAQHPIGRYFADFALVEERIVIEVDGAYWHDAERDAVRDHTLAASGWLVLRFPGRDVETRLPDCIAAIQRTRLAPRQ